MRCVLFYLHTCDKPTAVNIFGRLPVERYADKARAAVTLQEKIGFIGRDTEEGVGGGGGIGGGRGWGCPRGGIDIYITLCVEEVIWKGGGYGHRGRERIHGQCKAQYGCRELQSLMPTRGRGGKEHIIIISLRNETLC